ncbi:MAG: hypothetical protein K2V38_06175, partial [Gemmataceae bacterium]|nr:hypothetical protein [Gemmataceae bacterium]
GAAVATGADYAARADLLDLFAKSDADVGPTGIGDWLDDVARLYAQTKDKKVRLLIREKVQEFAEAFIPDKVRLDDNVFLQGKLVPRRGITVFYEEKLGGARMRKPLSDDPEGLNELSLEGKPPGVNAGLTDGATEYELRALKPTELSKAAAAYLEERRKLLERPPAGRWAANSAADLKKACDRQKELVDQLRKPGGGAAVPPPKIASRLAGLVAGMAAHKELFEGEP